MERGRSHLGYVTSGWAGIHWATLRAVVRRGGTFNSPSSGYHDLPAQVASPVLDGIAFGWSEYFGDKLKDVLEKATERLLGMADKHGREVLIAAGQVYRDEQGGLHGDLVKTLEMSEKIVREHVAQVSQRIERHVDEVRRELYEQIPEQIAANMEAAFTAAANEHGAGMKGRMVKMLSDRAFDVSDTMFADAEEAIMDGVRSLSDWLGGRFNEMTEVVRRNYDVHRENLLSTDRTPLEDLKRQEREVLEAERLLEEVRRQPEFKLGFTAHVAEGADQDNSLPTHPKVPAQGVMPS